ncbi:hypothetical protein BC567DRAFT_238879 [Phyllosticta citribraziliensis]
MRVATAMPMPLTTTTATTLASPSQPQTQTQTPTRAASNSAGRANPIRTCTATRRATSRTCWTTGGGWRGAMANAIATATASCEGEGALFLWLVCYSFCQGLLRLCTAYAP